MNLYIRYFDDECVVKNVDEALQFISGFQGFTITSQFEQEFREYAESDVPYPKRYKVRPRIYFIVIKTLANTLEEFKANGKNNSAGEAQPAAEETAGTGEAISKSSRKELLQMRLNDINPGWYDIEMYFKRVMLNPQTGKYDYIDTIFGARLKAFSVQDCYNRVVDHLRSRGDIDQRSQFPSIKGRNFRWTFLGLKPLESFEVK
ncbi:MAG: hypothetical protein K6F94_07125 [Bacteroidaceae bacterium]|nr:hypothetical protein [Bacteroidaceae bacterium]